jgi:anthranilate phosphoribosyltransferase
MVINVQQGLKRVLEEREPLTRAEAASLLRAILTEAPPDLQLAALLGAMASRGETPAEIAGFVDTMRELATPVPLTDAERSSLVDTCGTGGDLSGTFNISTAAALVAAAAGATVAKHGNRAVTSRSGSADVLEALGIPVGLSPEEAAAALRRHRFAFLHAPNHHPALKAVSPVRRALGVRTIFNIVGPLTNPACAQAQVMGVYSAHLVPIVAEAMLLLGVRHAFVVHGAGGLDELSISGFSEVAEVKDGAVAAGLLSFADFGIAPAPLEALRGGDAAENAAILGAVFAGERGPHRDIVLLNAAVVLTVAGVAPNPGRAFQLAAEAIDSGSVSELVRQLST